MISVLMEGKFELFEYLTKLLHCKSTPEILEYLISMLSVISNFLSTPEISFSIFLYQQSCKYPNTKYNKKINQNFVDPSEAD